MTSGAARAFSAAALLGGAAQLLGVVLLIPFAILAIGAPFALVIAGLLWLARLARAAF